MAVYLAFFVATVVFLRPVIGGEITLLLVAGAMVFTVIGLFDDLRNVGAWKLAVEAAVVIVIVWLGGFRLILPWPYLGDILAVLWIVGIANAVNCLDSADGIAAGTAVIGSLALTVLAALGHRWGIAVGTAAVAGAALGFLRYNFTPARIFLGDAGSLTLGFLLAAFAATMANPTKASLGEAIAPVLVVALPCADFLLVHFRRYNNGVRNLFRLLTSSGKDHLPHRLLDAGVSPRRMALWIYGVSALLGATAVALEVWGPPIALLSLAVVGSLVWRRAAGTQAVRASTELRWLFRQGEPLTSPGGTSKT